MTESSKETQSTQSSSSRPWQEAMPLVSSLLGKYGNLDPSLTGGQQSALTNLNSSLSSLPNFGGAASTAIGNIFSGSSAPQVGMLQSAYDTSKANLSPTASGANLDPYSTPGFGDALKTTMDDITNRVKSTYAASGRDPSGAGSFAGSLGRGLTQGVAPTIAGQYNQNYSNMIAANNQLFGNAVNSASALNNLRSSDTQNWLAGLQGASSIPGLYSSPALAQLGAANTGFAMPYQNLAQLLQPSLALAGLGTNSTGQSNSVQTSTPSLLSSIGQGIGGVGSALQLGPSIMALFSDKRLKKNIAPVGKLHDGQTVYRYEYKGSNVPQIGLLAQDVEKVHPEAVSRHHSGYKMVRYDLATRGARVGELAA